jgi:hypothetical protein
MTLNEWLIFGGINILGALAFALCICVAGKA